VRTCRNLRPTLALLLGMLLLASSAFPGAVTAAQNPDQAATPIAADPSPTATSTPTPTPEPSVTPEPTATESSLQSQVVPPLLTVNNTQTGVEVPAGSTVNVLAVGLPETSPATLQHFADAGCGSAAGTGATGTTSDSGSIQWAVVQDTVGVFSYQVIAGDVITNCVPVSVTPPAGLTLAFNNASGVVTVAVGESSWVQLTGAEPESIGSFTLYESPDCSAAGTEIPMDLPVNPDGTYTDDEWSFDDPGVYSLQAAFPNGQISNCVTIVAEPSAPPVLTVNGSAGPLVVAPDSSLEIAATGLPPTTSVFLGMWVAPGCSGDASSATSFESGASGSIATTSQMTGASVAYRVDIDLGGQQVSTNCVSVAADAAQPIVLSIDGYVDYAPMGATHASNFVITGLDSANAPYYLNYFADPDLSCAGLPTSSTDLSLLDPDYGTTAEFTMDSLHAYNVTSSGGEVSNCVYVEHWVGSPVPRLAVNGHAVRYVGTVGTTAKEAFEEGGVGGFTFFRYETADCSGDETIEAVGLTPDGTVDRTIALNVVGVRSYRAQTENGLTNCVTVYTIDDSFIQTPLLTISGSTGPVNIVPLTTYPVVSTGWIPGISVDHLIFLSDSCTGTPMPISTAIIPDDDGMLPPGNVHLQDANFPVVSYQFKSAIQTSNCVTVYVHDELPLTPTLTVNNQSGPLQVTTGADLGMFITGFPEATDVVVFQFAGVGCEGGGLAWDALTTDEFGRAGNTLSAPSEAGSISLLAAELEGDTPPTTNCVDVHVVDSPAPVLTANNSTGPVVVEFDDPVTLFVTGLPGDTAVTILQFGGADCSGEGTQVASGTSLASGSFLTSATLEPGATASFRVEDPVSNCVNVSVGEDPQPPADPVLSVNNSTGPLTVNAGDTVNLLVTGLPENDVAFDAAAVEVQLLRFDAAGCTGTGTVVVQGTSNDAGAFSGTDILDVAGTYSYMGTGGNLTSNCVDVTVQAVATPTPTGTLAPTATATPREILPGRTPEPDATATATSTTAASGGAVTTLPSTGAEPGEESPSWLWMAIVGGVFLLGAVALFRKSNRRL